MSVDSQFSHLAWIQTDRKEGGIGDLNYPLVADLKKEVSNAFNVLTDDGIALRGLFIIDKEGVIQHCTINNLAFGRSVDETKRVLQVCGGLASLVGFRGPGRFVVAGTSTRVVAALIEYLAQSSRSEPGSTLVDMYGHTCVHHNPVHVLSAI